MPPSYSRQGRPAGCGRDEVLATLPALAVFLALQRYFVEGIAPTGLKG